MPSGTTTLDLDYCTFYGNSDAIEVYRSSSSYYLTLNIDRSIFAANTVGIRDSSYYQATFNCGYSNAWGNTGDAFKTDHVKSIRNETR